MAGVVTGAAATSVTIFSSSNQIVSDGYEWDMQEENIFESTKTLREQVKEYYKGVNYSGNQLVRIIADDATVVEPFFAFYAFMGADMRRNPVKRKFVRHCGKVRAVAPVATEPVQEVKEYVLTSWAKFDLGLSPVYWKTMNGLPPAAGEKLKLFYNPAATKLIPNEEFGIGFNGGFNQPIMCGGEPRAMLQKVRGKADAPIYTIQICVPKHAMSLIFSFTNGTEWDGPYRLQFQVPKAWRNKPMDFFTEGLAEELSKDGACDKAIFPDTSVVSDRCAIIGNLTLEGGDRCNLDLVLGCTDPSSPMFNPLANVDDGSCLPYSDSEE